MKRTLVTGKHFIEQTGINARKFYRHLKQNKLDYYVIEGKNRKWFLEPLPFPKKRRKEKKES
ncbi:MAG: hypothetical protein A2172_00185 [Candidatus Woykebacteria bacterium RBG_13_40_15]|uniref:Uncharacterized protein n=1 Tax=Candidatus Woykebacteria bacterium RBG_13_40_15 TaxID=1802593 RepID=A0A1G1W9G9_9BACT|nr:MAG: hypothetical protein A2172_00185 [Candidatus Woykebacteria bacterium RBG_13_40_15]